MKTLPWLFMSSMTAALVVAQEPTVPSALVLQAGGPPLALAMKLAAAGVPSGLELKEQDFVPPIGIDFEVDRSATVDSAALVNAFNGQHADYRAVQMGGAIVIRPVSRMTQALEINSPVTAPLVVTGAMNALRHILIPGSSSSAPVITIGAAAEGGDFTVRLVGGTRVIDSLNQLVTQHQRAWYVLTREIDRESVVTRAGLIQGNGTINSFDLVRR